MEKPRPLRTTACIHLVPSPLARIALPTAECNHCQREWIYSCHLPEIKSCTRWHRVEPLTCCQDCAHYQPRNARG